MCLYTNKSKLIIKTVIKENIVLHALTAKCYIWFIQQTSHL